MNPAESIFIPKSIRIPIQIFAQRYVFFFDCLIVLTILFNVIYLRLIFKKVTIFHIFNLIIFHIVIYLI